MHHPYRIHTHTVRSTEYLDSTEYKAETTEVHYGRTRFYALFVFLSLSVSF